MGLQYGHDITTTTPVAGFSVPAIDVRPTVTTGKLDQDDRQEVHKWRIFLLSPFLPDSFLAPLPF